MLSHGTTFLNISGRQCLSRNFDNSILYSAPLLGAAVPKRLPLYTLALLEVSLPSSSRPSNGAFQACTSFCQALQSDKDRKQQSMALLVRKSLRKLPFPCQVLTAAWSCYLALECICLVLGSAPVVSLFKAQIHLIYDTQHRHLACTGLGLVSAMLFKRKLRLVHTKTGKNLHWNVLHSSTQLQISTLKATCKFILI